MLSFLGQYRMALCEFNACTCRPAGALEGGGSAFLQTCRPAGAKMRRISRFY